MGELTNEVNPRDGDNIQCFVSGGPKNYAYRLDTGKTCCKVRGFTLNFRNSQKINFDTVHMVKNMNNQIISVTNLNNITRDPKTKTIQTKPLTKEYRVCYDKIIILRDYNTVPCGYHQS